MTFRQGERLPLPLDFKGDRTYLHGTAMLDALCGIVPDMQNISLKIQKIAEHPVAAVGLPDEAVNRRDLVAILAADEDGTRIEIGLESAPDGTPPGRYAYDEAGVIAAAEIAPEDRKARMPRNPDHTFIEQLVALQKALLQRCFPDAGVHWYFSRLEIARLPNGFGTLSLSVAQALGTSLVKSAIDVDGAAMGDIYFSGVKQ